MIELLEILAGLLLLRDTLRQTKLLAKIIAAVDPFDIVIGVVILVVGILNILSLKGILLSLAGLALAASALSNVPKVGTALTQAGRYVAQFRLPIGIVVLIVGLAEAISILLRSISAGPPYK